MSNTADIVTRNRYRRRVMGTKKEDFSENMIDSAVKAFGTVMKKAEERGHQEATKGSGVGALIGGLLGSFAGPFGAAGGAKKE